MKKIIVGLLLCVAGNAFGMNKKPTFRLTQMFSESKETREGLVYLLRKSEYRSYADYINYTGLSDHAVYHNKYAHELICCFSQILHEMPMKYDLKKMADELSNCGVDAFDQDKLRDIRNISGALVGMQGDLSVISGKLDEVLKERRDRALLESIHLRRCRKD